MNERLTPPPGGQESARKRKLLLVEDEPSLCQFLGELLATEYAVETVPNGEQAWLAIQQGRPDMVLSNVNMPAGNGLELVRRMRNTPATAALPVLLLTARADHASLRTSEAVGANGLVRKPFRLGELLTALRGLGQPAAGI